MKQQPTTHTLVGLYMRKDGTEEYEIWLAPECPFDCKECTVKSVADATRFGADEKFKVKKIEFQE